MSLAACRGLCEQGRRPCSHPLRCSVESEGVVGLFIHRSGTTEREIRIVPGWWHRLRRVLRSFSHQWIARRGDLLLAKRARSGRGRRLRLRVGSSA